MPSPHTHRPPHLQRLYEAAKRLEAARVRREYWERLAKALGKPKK